MSITYTALVGTTASTSPTTYGNAFTTLAGNNSTQAVAIGKSLVNNQHRFLLQKYFDNERTYSVDIIGATSITFTGTLAVGATSATLTVAWALPTCTQGVNFSSGDYRICQFIKNSTAVTWNAGLAATATTAAKTSGVRDYPIPMNVSKVKNVTVTVGQLVFQPIPVYSRQEWDLYNTLPYTSDIPKWCFIWNGTIGIFPIPSTPNNVLTFNYKTRVADLTFSDYSTGNVTGMTVGSYAVTGTATSWSATGAYPLNTDITFLNLCLRVDPPYGDGLWYPIQSFQSDTALTLAMPVINAPNITSASTYTIGQIPILQEDFHPLLVYNSLMVYFSTIVKDEAAFKMYEKLSADTMDLLKDYLGTKQTNLDLGDEANLSNTNLYLYYPVN